MLTRLAALIAITLTVTACDLETPDRSDVAGDGDGDAAGLEGDGDGDHLEPDLPPDDTAETGDGDGDGDGDMRPMPDMGDDETGDGDGDDPVDPMGVCCDCSTNDGGWSSCFPQSASLCGAAGDGFVWCEGVGSPDECFATCETA